MEGENLQGEYWEGRINLLVRLWIYLRAGLNQANEFKYLAAAIVGLFIFLRSDYGIDNLYVIGALGMLCAPPLMLLGRWQLFRVTKIQDWVSTQHASIFGYTGYNMSVKQTELAAKTVELLEEINRKLDKLKNEDR